MKKTAAALSALLIILAFFSFTPAGCPLDYKGIYAIKLDGEHSAVLRFYEDGTVLASSSVNDYMDVMSWFNKDNKDMVLKGTYKVKKCVVRFSVSGMTGEQKYEGTINGNKIDFELKDKDSKKSTKRTYTFYAL
ncbi:MAG: hypothetical protein JWO44_310 [Bacteroidetes bacterium]|nr:hypothetical protein [Bacteroidota bacterium]